MLYQIDKNAELFRLYTGWSKSAATIFIMLKAKLIETSHNRHGAQSKW